MLASNSTTCAWCILRIYSIRISIHKIQLRRTESIGSLGMGKYSTLEWRMNVQVTPRETESVATCRRRDCTPNWRNCELSMQRWNERLEELFIAIVLCCTMHNCTRMAVGAFYASIFVLDGKFFEINFIHFVPFFISRTLSSPSWNSSALCFQISLKTESSVWNWSYFSWNKIEMRVQVDT